MSRHSTRLRGGFASVVAVALIALIATALATMTSLFALELRRTTRQSADAQLRQLLIAGAFAAPENLGNGAVERTVTVALPDDLAATGATLKLRLTPAKGDQEA